MSTANIMPVATVAIVVALVANVNGNFRNQKNQKLNSEMAFCPRWRWAGGRATGQDGLNNFWSFWPFRAFSGNFHILEHF